jgi:hypothetical protein
VCAGYGLGVFHEGKLLVNVCGEEVNHKVGAVQLKLSDLSTYKKNIVDFTRWKKIKVEGWLKTEERGKRTAIFVLLLCIAMSKTPSTFKFILFINT